ncbi:hypothetical protein HU200_051674 [Digitaria exilis]|uniref:KIB1-4 beta-propeller domain-containing protein n=1 Tax=Digitaria exilis TaxID=1010633 RepID=A0A835B0S1_9POAL|nr:hypothetical protein HU200_051674 [Digitaria exilis]
MSSSTNRNHQSRNLSAEIKSLVPVPTRRRFSPFYFRQGQTGMRRRQAVVASSRNLVIILGCEARTPGTAAVALPQLGGPDVRANRDHRRTRAHYTNFRAVCRGWRRGTHDIHRPLGALDPRFHPRRWIMLREAKPPPGPDRHRRRFLNLDTGECVQKELPELEGHHLLGATTEGLLVLLDKSTYVVRMLNPATRQVDELPSIDPLLSKKTRKKISKYGHAYALKVTGVGLAGDSTIALCFLHPDGMLVVARPDDARWTPVESNGWLCTDMSFQGRFYCITVNGMAVMALDLDVTTTNQPPRLVVAAKLTCSPSLMQRHTVHLVESDGRLRLLHCKLFFTLREGFNGYIREYQAFEMDLAAKTTVPLGGLDGHAVFLGKTRALSVSSLVFPSIRHDRVYLAADIQEKSN